MRSLAVVDGDPIFKKIVEIMLNKLHFSGKINFYDDALAFLNASTVCDGQQLWLPDIILLDLHLPELDL
ncbi:hypothetical protein ABDD95_20580 [Mucilaginibacter sp. PAMB04274]|uniref:hypothetical protein n=1 Tax=Mucilaginibacter sp. PAMB04274 TaxID=3138568 RepID=UPI0031F6CF9B